MKNEYGKKLNGDALKEAAVRLRNMAPCTGVIITILEGAELETLKKLVKEFPDGVWHVVETPPMHGYTYNYGPESELMDANDVIDEFVEYLNRSSDLMTPEIAEAWVEDYVENYDGELTEDDIAMLEEDFLYGVKLILDNMAEAVYDDGWDEIRK